jgi:hypothetical protein
MRLTRKKALEDTYSIWNKIAEYLADEAKRDRYRCFKNLVGLKLRACQILNLTQYTGTSYCPCCAYKASRRLTCRRGCPVRKWRKINCCEGQEYGSFLYDPSVKNALAIATLAEEELDKYKI